MIDSVHLNFIGQAPESLYEYVEFIDGENYFSGAVGQIKKITDKDSDGNITKYTVFYYANSSRPTKVTSSKTFRGDE